MYSGSSLEEEEFLLGWENIVVWGFLKNDFNYLTEDKDIEVAEVLSAHQVLSFQSVSSVS